MSDPLNIEDTLFVSRHRVPDGHPALHAKTWKFRYLDDLPEPLLYWWMSDCIALHQNLLSETDGLWVEDRRINGLWSGFTVMHIIQGLRCYAMGKPVGWLLNSWESRMRQRDSDTGLGQWVLCSSKKERRAHPDCVYRLMCRSSLKPPLSLACRDVARDMISLLSRPFLYHRLRYLAQAWNLTADRQWWVMDCLNEGRASEIPVECHPDAEFGSVDWLGWELGALADFMPPGQVNK